MYTLHYAPDNASLVIRLVLEELGQTYRTQLVDRSTRQQDSAAYRALNPAGLIPVLETPHGPIAETAAIGLWLGETHGALVPSLGASERPAFLQTLFFLANTIHADLRMVFYPAQYAGPERSDQERLHGHVTARLKRHLAVIDARMAASGWSEADAQHGRGQITLNVIYLSVMLRWAALYGACGSDWFDLSRYPALAAMARVVETRASVQAAVSAEGLGPTPFSAPSPCCPPEGSALG